MKKYVLSAACAVGCLLAACTAQESYKNAQSCEQVQLGMTQDQVRHLMGKPTGEDPKDGNGTTWSYLFGSATDTTPIRIEFGADGKVQAKTCAPQASGKERPTGN
ncbi:MAG TPA: outer membrane protein assembly factor BamE [Hymenobacter sp.]|jgi:outer membrane protein assembly factor BamE (lipoprotein component of BamABCDE complex)